MAKTIYASQTGAKLNSNVYTGGGTDDTQVLQAALDEGKNGGVHLIMDGAALITGLVLYSNTTIECLNKDCGFYLADNTNGSLLRNANQSFRVIQDYNIRITGGTYNHNCMHQEHDVPATEETAIYREIDSSVFQGRYWPMGFEFFGIEGLEISDIILRDQNTFGMLIANWKNVEITDVLIDLPHHIDFRNQDGIHFWGPGQFLTMRNIRGRSGDDFIALAPDEHDRVSSITDVLIDGVVLDEADQGIRLLSRERGRLDRVTIRNVTGTYKSFGFFINSWYPSSFGGDFGNIVFENIDLKPLEPNYTYRPPFLFQMGGHIEHITLRGIQDNHPEEQRTLVEVSAPSVTLSQEECATYIDELTVDGLNILQENTPSVPAFVIEGEIGRLSMGNMKIRYKQKSEVPFMQCKSPGQIHLLELENIAAENAGQIIPDEAEEKIIRNFYSDDRRL